MPAIDYVKHLVECHCVLPQFKHFEPPVWHQFIAFSEIDDKGGVIPSYVKCNNCGVIHKVSEVGVSSILKREDLGTLPQIDELKQDIPEKFLPTLERYNCEVTTYQEVAFIFRNEKWGKAVILTKDKIDGTTVGKYAVIMGQSLWKVQNFEDAGNEIVEETT